MSKQSKPVSLTNNSTAQNLSRQVLLAWVNSITKGNYKKVENLGTGEAYCLMLESLYPNSMAMKNVKKGAVQEYQFLHNFKLFQAGLAKIGCEKEVPMLRLAMCKFQDNLEFLQWFYKFYDAQVANGAPDGAGEPEELK